MLKKMHKRMHKLKLWSLAGWVGEGRYHGLPGVHDGFNTRSFEAHRLDGSEGFDEEVPDGSTSADRIFLGARLGPRLHYDCKVVFLTALSYRGLPKPLPGWILSLEWLQAQHCNFVMATLPSAKNVTSFVPITEAHRKHLLEETKRRHGAKRKWSRYVLSARSHNKLHETWSNLPAMPGLFGALGVRHDVMQEFRRRLREYCKHLDDAEREPLIIPWSNVCLPLDWRPKPVPNDDPTENTAWKSFSFVYGAMQRSTYRKKHGLRWTFPEFAPLGGDGLLQEHGHDEDVKEELKWGLVTEFSDGTVRFRRAFEHGRTSVFSPFNAYDYSTWISADKSFLYHLPKSIERLSWFHEFEAAGHLDVEQRELAQFRVELSTERDWIEDWHAIIKRHSRRPQTSYVIDREVFREFAMSYRLGQDLHGETEERSGEASDDEDDEDDEHDEDDSSSGEEDTDSDEAPDDDAKSGRLNLLTNNWEVAIDLANDIAAHQGFGVFMRTMCDHIRLPQILFYGYTWTRKDQYVYETTGRLPVDCHPGSMSPWAAVMGFRTLSTKPTPAAFTDRNVTWASYFRLGNLSEPLAFPCMNIISPHSILPGITQSSMLIADEHLQLDQLKRIRGKLVTKNQHGSATDLRPLQKFCDLPLQNLHVHHGEDFYRHVVALYDSHRPGIAKTVSWAEGPSIPLTGKYLTNMGKYWQAVVDCLGPSQLHLGL